QVTSCHLAVGVLVNCGSSSLYPFECLVRPEPPGRRCGRSRRQQVSVEPAPVVAHLTALRRCPRVHDTNPENAPGTEPWWELAALSETELARRDLAEVHLACAVGLPSSVPLDIPTCSRQIDEIVGKVRATTERLAPYYE